jgi:hypothetical protein
VYEVNRTDEARAATAALPVDALKALAELVDVLVLDPHVGGPYHEPDSDLRTIMLADGDLLAVWLVLEAQHRVELLRLLWLGAEAP